MLRSTLAILAGFFTVFIVSRICDFAFAQLRPGYGPHAYIGGGVALIVLLYGTLSIWLGGYITGMISRKHYIMHGVILACLGLLIAIPINIKFWHESPAWYHIIGLLLVIPATAWGAHVAGKRHERKAALAA